MSGAWLDRSPSYAAGLSHGDVLASEQEWRIRAVLAGHGSGVAVDEVLDGDEVAGRAMAMIRAWASDLLTRFDGTTLKSLGTSQKHWVIEEGGPLYVQ